MSLVRSLALLTGCATLVMAQDSFIVGPRALGMGGTGVASVDDVPAQYYNPAAFGFFAYQPPAEEQSDKGPFSVDNNALWRKDWGAAADFTFGARIHEDFAKYINTLKKYYDDGTINRLSSTGLSNEADALAMVETFNALSSLADSDNAITADVTGGFAVRIKHFGLGVRTYGQVSGRLQTLDLTNLGIGGFGNDVIDSELGGVTVNGPGGTLSSSQASALQTTGNFSAGSVTKLDQLMTQAGLSSAEVDLLVNSLIQANNNTGGNLDSNLSSLRMYGVNVIEIPLSFGYAFNEHLAIGGNLKAMIGRVYGTDVVVFGSDVANAIRNADENYQQTVTWGVDLALMARVKLFNFGLTARNLNSPTFDGPTVGATKFPDYEVKPTVTAGAAFIPFETVTVALDLDLIESETVLSSYKSQYVRLGGEWDIFRTIALRGGYSENLAESDIGGLIHAGVGVNLWLMRIDVAGSMALKTTEYDGNKVPREARVGLQLATDW